MRFLDEKLVALEVPVDTPEAAIREAGKLLFQNGLITENYLEAMVASYLKNGPYIVLAPHIALPHARPEDGVKEACVSLIQLKHPIRFGHKTNDPVSLVFALGATTGELHLQLLQRLSMILGNAGNVRKLIDARDYQTMKTVIGGD